MKTFLLALESLHGPGLCSSVGYFLTSHCFLTLTSGREQEDLVGVKIILKSIVRLINTAFQPSWTKGLLDSQPSVRALARLP